MLPVLKIFALLNKSDRFLLFFLEIHSKKFRETIYFFFFFVNFKLFLKKLEQIYVLQSVRERINRVKNRKTVYNARIIKPADVIVLFV